MWHCEFFKRQREDEQGMNGIFFFLQFSLIFIEIDIFLIFL